jgi:hypothetical protein
MKKILPSLLLLAVLSTGSGCSFFQNVFKGKEKKGCPSNGANVGAEKILSGDPEAAKSIKKGKKFKAGKF